MKGRTSLRLLKKKKKFVLVRTKEVGVDLNIPEHGWKRRALKLERRGGV